MTAPQEKEVIICNKRGLHARAAALFVEKAGRFAASISVSKENLSVSGRSIMGLLLLAAAKGDAIRIKAEGRDAGEALEALEKLVENRFQEQD